MESTLKPQTGPERELIRKLIASPEAQGSEHIAHCRSGNTDYRL